MYHTTAGVRVTIAPGSRVSDMDINQAKRQGRPLNANGQGTGGYDFIIGPSGRVVQTNDPYVRSTVHGHTGNQRFIGVGLAQTAKGIVQQAQIDTAVLLGDLLTWFFTLPRQIYVDDKGSPYAGRIEPLERSGGSEIAGAIGHRNAWVRGSSGRLSAAKPYGDPGDEVFIALANAGYEKVSTSDWGQPIWRDRQKALGLAAVDCDGIVGQRTRDAIKRVNASYVKRPCDGTLPRV